jgi:hypothetical protein
MEAEISEDIVEIVGTLFIADDDAVGERVLGIDTDEEEILFSEDDLEENLRELEGEVVTAKGTLWLDEDGNSWLDLISLDVASD